MAFRETRRDTDTVYRQVDTTSSNGSIDESSTRERTGQGGQSSSQNTSNSSTSETTGNGTKTTTGVKTEVQTQNQSSQGEMVERSNSSQKGASESTGERVTTSSRDLTSTQNSKGNTIEKVNIGYRLQFSIKLDGGTGTQLPTRKLQMRQKLDITTAPQNVTLELGEEYFLEVTSGSASSVIVKQQVDASGTYEAMAGSPVAAGESYPVINISESQVVQLSVASGTATAFLMKPNAKTVISK